ncbi:rhodanese-related sulfurtransferase [Gracilibacillus halotolerans]|uniref:Rhodanese-related sulfurtransferase n=1 Tax=Gracilibacillus halotolerans TaxID=74386 RepID=A0A841RJB0_9BACI|nr:rhodanese-like domain-containing protein [Gracilibacillus halotolerans]MBB6512072.1 rhodanese-related sulfurtransferase [Gracilibacillus halotolerans]
MKEITAKELEQKIDAGEEVNIIDVREDEEVAGGKIPGAKHIPLGQIPDRLDEINKNEHYYIVCRSGGRSGRACDYLQEKGYDTTNMVGGMLDWEGEVEF